MFADGAGAVALADLTDGESNTTHTTHTTHLAQPYSPALFTAMTPTVTPSRISSGSALVVFAAGS